MSGYDVTVHADASADRLWSLIMNPQTWPAWSLVDELVGHRPAGVGSDGVDGVGTIRTFRTGRAVTSEIITALEPGRHFGYAGYENFVLRDYVAAIDLSPAAAGGTDIRWHGTFRTRRGLNLFMSAYLQRFQTRMARGLARAT